MVTNLVDKNQNVAPISITVVEDQRLKVSLAQTSFTGDFHYRMNASAQLEVASEAEEVLRQALLTQLTVQKGTQTVASSVIADIKFGATDIAQGAILRQARILYTLLSNNHR